MTVTQSGTRFAFAFAPAYRLAARPFGITPDRAYVLVGRHELDAHFGPWRLRTPLANIVAVEITGPYAFAKTAGSARLGITDLGLTFATNSQRGLRMGFAERVPGIDPLGLLRHGELTVTVAEIERLRDLLIADPETNIDPRG